jgi:hypothetical protein
MNFGFSDEPAVWISVVDALIILAVTFGLPITPEQKGAIDAVLAAAAGVLIRSQVTPVAKIAPSLPLPAPGAPLTAEQLEQRVADLETQRLWAIAQLGKIAEITGPAPAGPTGTT